MCLHQIGTSLACRVATPGVMVMLAWVVRCGADGCRPQHTLMSAEIGQKFRFAMRKVFPLGADAGLLRDQLPIPLRVLAGFQGSWRLLGLASTHSWRSNFVFQAAAF